MLHYFNFFLSIFLWWHLNDNNYPVHSGIQHKIASEARVRIGAEILLDERLNLIEGKNIGFVTNHTAILPDGRHLIDTLSSTAGIKITALFGPEHGIRGETSDGQIVDDLRDGITGLPVYSLYGEVRKPTAEMLKGIDILMFDIQDVGARFYTYLSTMYYVMQAAAENDLPVFVLDRPNPIGGTAVDGPVILQDLFSFVGRIPVPVQHGMTMGELALMINNENWLGEGLKADLKVIKMENWHRNLYFDECGLPWVKPSPNMIDLNTALLYPGLCLLEGTNVSEGRGTYKPFTTFGAPFIDSDELITLLDSYNINGIAYKNTEFIPVEIPGMAIKPKFEDEKCRGLELIVNDRSGFKPVEFSVYLIYSINKLYPNKFSFKESRIDKLFGDSFLRKDISAGKNPDDIIAKWKGGLESFIELRSRYLLY